MKKGKLSKLLLAMASVALASSLAAPAMALATDHNASTQEELNAAVLNAASGDTIVLAEGVYELPGFKNMELTFKGLESDRSKAVIKDCLDGRDQKLTGSTINFESLTAQSITGHYPGLPHTNKVTYTNCNIKGNRILYAPEVVFKSCDFDSEGAEHSFWTYGSKKVTVTNCDFVYKDRAVNCYGEDGQYQTNVMFENCTFAYEGDKGSPEGAVEINSGSPSEQKPAVMIPINVTFNENCTAPEKGAMWYISPWDHEDGLYTTVKIDGEQVWPVVVAEIGNTKYETLQKAVEAAASGDLVKLIKDITLTEADCVVGADRKVLIDVADKDITLDMNEKTISVVHEDAFTNDYIVAVIRVADGAGLTVTGNGAIDVKARVEDPDIAYMFWKRGTTGHLTIENGTYHMNDSADSMVYTNGNEIVTVNGGTWTLDARGTRENGQPWIFNVQGAGDNHVIVKGGTYNADINRQHWANEVLVPETYYTVNNGNGTWTVKEGAALYATEGILTGPFYVKDWKIGYPSLEAFFAAANASDEDTTDAYDPITLLKDVAVSGDIDAGKINQNGKVITLSANASLKSESELDVAAIPGYYVAIEGDAESGYTYTARPNPYIPPAPLPETGCTTADACNVFPDFDEDAWYHDYMDWAYENGIITGYDTGLLGPEDHSTRAQVVTVLYRLAGSPNATGEGAWYADAFAWALEAGIVKGYDDDPTKLGESDVITRQQIATIMHRFAVHMGWDVSVGEDTNILSYPDAADVDEYAVAAMQWAVGMGIIGGYGDTGELAPAAGTERCELAAMLFRLNEAYDVL